MAWKQVSHGMKDNVRGDSPCNGERVVIGFHRLGNGNSNSAMKSPQDCIGCHRMSQDCIGFHRIGNGSNNAAMEKSIGIHRIA